MKVLVDSNLHISRVFEPPLELDLDGESHILRDVLEELANRCKSIQFLQDDGEAGSDIDTVLLNGKEYYSLSRGFRSPLNEGDMVTVEIYMDPLGGG